jgi:hypothetical protein
VSKEVYRNEEHYCWVYQDGEDYFLSTICGGSGMFEVMIKMTPDEVDQFRQDQTSVVELARDLCHRLDHYRDRTLDVPSAEKLRAP